MTTTSAAAAAIAASRARAPQAPDPAATLFHAAQLLLPDLERGQRIDTARLRAAMEQAFGGSDSQGAWGWKSAYDACEAAAVLFLRRFGSAMAARAGSPAELLPMLGKVTTLLPSHTRRSEASETFQQFSTPLALGIAVNDAAGITPGDHVLEPSAGTGLLAIFAELAGASLMLNELAETRAGLLCHLFPDVAVTRFDGAQIDDHLGSGAKPGVVLMNPPFSAARSDRKEADEPAMFQYYIEQIFERLDKSGTIDPDRVARLEWIYLQVLEHSNRPPVTLHKQLASRPEFFVEVLSTIYRASNEEPNQQEEDRESKAALASHAWTLLHSWNVLPGFSEGKVDGAALEEWVSKARRLSHEAGRADIGDEQIGQILAWAPADPDGTWPCEAVRDVIEMARSRHLETGVYIGVKNRRGATSRGVTDGGERERDLAKQYRDHADAVRFEWPRTAAVLGRIAESYEAEAKEHDDDVERYQW